MKCLSRCLLPCLTLSGVLLATFIVLSPKSPFAAFFMLDIQPKSQAPEYLVEYATSFAGRTATNCGFVGYGENATKANQCVLQADIKSKPFFIWYQSSDIKGKIAYDGFARGDDGYLKSIRYVRNSPVEVSSVPTFSAEPCQMMWMKDGLAHNLVCGTGSIDI